MTDVQTEVREMKRLSGLSNLSLAVQLGREERTIQRWLNGDAKPNLVDLIKLHKLCEERGAL